MSNTQGGWQPDGQFGPPEYEPVHHEPRRPRARHRAEPPPAPAPLPPAPGPLPPAPLPPAPVPGWRPGSQPQPRPQPSFHPHPQLQQPYPPQRPLQPLQPQQQPFQQPQWQGGHGQDRQEYPHPGQYAGDGQYEGHPPGGYDGYPPGAYDGYPPGQYDDRFVPGFAGDAGYPPDDTAYQADFSQPPPPRRRRGKLRRLAPLIAVLIILAPIAYGAWWGYSLYQSKYHPADYTGAGTGEVTVQVKQGDTAFSLAPQLLSLGVIASNRAFELAAEHSSSPSGLLPGFFRLHEHMQASLAYAALLNPANLMVNRVTLREGLRLTDILSILAGKTSQISKADYEKALTDPNLGLPSYAHGKAEGYLFPATYQIAPNATALSVLQQMVTTFKAQAANANLVNGAAKVHLTGPAEVITVASLVQAEGGQLSDFPKIARVIYNRLSQDMALDLDSSVLYGLNTYGILANPAQLQSTSPYNTYKFKGLPPGPIDSPGAAAIQAALNPAPGNWLYFVTVNPKTKLTLFTASYAQFQQYQQELRHNLGQ